MAELIAIGKGAQRQLRRALVEGEEFVLGRAPRTGWAVPWDRLISREHATLRLVGAELEVVALETARNPVLLDGLPNSTFRIAPGAAFRIGDTSFHFRGADQGETSESGGAGPQRSDEVLSSEKFTSPSSCLHALCQMPAIIADSKSDAELAERLVELLLDSIRGASAVAVLRLLGGPDDAGAEPLLVSWNTRDETVRRFRPSRRLVRRAFEHGQSVVHLWVSDETDTDADFTMNEDLDWAFCTPLEVGMAERWCLYVSGKRRFAGVRDVGAPRDLIGELRTAELVARFIGAVRQARALEHQHAEMRRYFSPAVVESLAGDLRALEPRVGPVSVLFCDVRGFSRKVEASQDLHAVLEQVSLALSVMTRSILRYEGVIADFQGDAALAFWGWPSPIDDAAALACRAALLIYDTFERAGRTPGHPLNGFHVGIGVGHGDAIAGKIGAQEQIKVGVFGPVVNLASRLQDLTKGVGAAILVDGPSAAAASSALRGDEGVFRPLPRLRPAGTHTPVQPFALYSLAGGPLGLTPADLAAYDTALCAFGAGDWGAASATLAPLLDADPLARFLRQAIDAVGPTPPPGWDGVLNMAREGRVEPPC